MPGFEGEMREKDANITLMIQADMLAYHVGTSLCPISSEARIVIYVYAEGERPQLGLPKTIGTPEVTQLVANISEIYSPELEVGFTAVRTVPS